MGNWESELVVLRAEGENFLIYPYHKRKPDKRETEENRYQFNAEYTFRHWIAKKIREKLTSSLVHAWCSVVLCLDI